MEKEKKLRALCHASEDISACDNNTSFYNCLRNYYNQAYHNRFDKNIIYKEH